MVHACGDGINVCVRCDDAAISIGTRLAGTGSSNGTCNSEMNVSVRHDNADTCIGVRLEDTGIFNGTCDAGISTCDEGTRPRSRRRRRKGRKGAESTRSDVDSNASACVHSDMFELPNVRGVICSECFAATAKCVRVKSREFFDMLAHVEGYDSAHAEKVVLAVHESDDLEQAHAIAVMDIAWQKLQAMPNGSRQKGKAKKSYFAARGAAAELLM